MMYPKFLRKILTKLFCRKNIYLEEIGQNSYASNQFGGIYNFGSLTGAIRNNREFRRTGVDPRDCWGLDSAFFCWLYCNLKQLLKDTNCDLTWKTYRHKNKKYTEGELIEYLIDLCKQIILYDEFKDCPEIEWEREEIKDEDGNVTINCKNSEEDSEKFRQQWKKNNEELEALEDEVFKVFRKLLHNLWW